MNQLAPITASYAPALVAATAPRASYRFLEFFVRPKPPLLPRFHLATVFTRWGMVTVTA